MLESKKNSIVQLDSRPKHRAKRNQQLRQKESIKTGLFCWNKLCVLTCALKKKRKTLEVQGLDRNSSKKVTVYYQSRAGCSLSETRSSPFFLSIFNTIPKISCLSFLPFAHYFSKKKKKSQFDLIGFHLSLPGNKK